MIPNFHIYTFYAFMYNRGLKENIQKYSHWLLLIPGFKIKHFLYFTNTCIIVIITKNT